MLISENGVNAFGNPSVIAHVKVQRKMFRDQPKEFYDARILKFVAR